MSEGTVLWFNPNKRYGFIGSEENEKDVFVHMTDVEEAGLSGLSEGQRVAFETIDFDGRLKATNIKILDS